MATMEELKEKFDSLSDDEKIAFVKSVMPSFCQVFGKNPDRMMSEMMPLCKDMMKSCNMDMQGMMRMMGMMGAMGASKG